MSETADETGKARRVTGAYGSSEGRFLRPEYILAAIFGLGGVGIGGGAGVLGTNQVAALGAKIDASGAKIDAVVTAITKLEARLEIADDRYAQNLKKIDDHEARIRKLEETERRGGK